MTTILRMKRTFEILAYWVLSCACLAAFSGCKEVLDTPSDDLDQSAGVPISFSSEEASTKAEFYDLTDMQNDGVTVWGAITSASSDNGIEVFGSRGTPLTYNQIRNEWTYSPVRYWLRGNYEFCAIYPFTDNVDVNYGDLGYCILDYILDQTDLLVASNTVESNGISSPGTVALNFQHALCQLEFKAKSASTDNLKAILYGIDIQNAAVSATFDASEGKWKDHSVSEDPIYIVKGSDNLISSEYTTLESGILMLPQDFSGIQLVVRYYGIGADNSLGQQTKVCTLPALNDGSSEWLPGKKYTYTLSVEGNEKIVFSAPTVTPWVSASGGNFIISTQ